MGNRGMAAAGVGFMLAVTACSSGSTGVLVQGSQPPPVVTGSPSAAVTSTPTPTASAPAVRAKRHKTVTATATTASPTPTVAAPRKTTRPKPTQTATRASACTTAGPTTTIKMVTAYRFSPSTVTINRCDAVKAVYADSSGATHNWVGPSWSSPDLSSNGQSYTYRFTSSGTFSFYCAYHQGFGMTGRVTVR